MRIPVPTLIVWLLLFCTTPTLLPSVAGGQEPQGFGNGNMEEADGERPAVWGVGKIEGLIFGMDSDNPAEGEMSAVVDSTQAKFQDGRGQFVSMSQRVDATPYRGKRLRFRAAVRTANLAVGAKAQLWMRVDRDNPPPSAFDNMQYRPITDEAWSHHDIVLDVGDDATQILLGMLVIGKGKAWLDDASLEEVGLEVEPTDMNLGSPSNAPDSDADEKTDEGEKKATPPTNASSDIMMKARQESETAPQQPFFNHWLWLVAIGFGLFLIAGWPRETPEPTNEGIEPEFQRQSWTGMIPRFAFFFTFAYWLLYNIPVPFSSLIPKYGPQFSAWYTSVKSDVIHWTAANVFNIQGELVPPMGSGDTTYSYIQVLIYFVLAIVIAVLWSSVDWFLVSRNGTRFHSLKDLLRSYLRYVLAFWMLSYGLGKVAWDANQFPLISEWQFQKQWGDSSPMNVVWSFMGTSQAYTIFAGSGEVVGALLLIWRRTAVLGALVTFGVMVNVMMLNYCYDIPVKLFSTHLVIMSIWILLPDIKRLTNVLFWNRTAEPADFRPPYTGPITIWIQRALKAALLIFMIAIPLYTHTQAQIAYFQARSELPEYFGQYEIEAFTLNGKPIDAANGQASWKSVRFMYGVNYTRERGRETRRKLVVAMENTPGMLSVPFNNDDDSLTLNLDPHGYPMLPKDEIRLEVIDSDHLKLTGETASGPLEVSLRRNENIYRVTGRGYRWINEVPYNR